MAVYFKGLNTDETTYLTDAMANSGDVLDLSEFGENTVDKHSTGGVGDKITLILLPLFGAGRSSRSKFSSGKPWHTGGTIDKLDSIQERIQHLFLLHK